MSKQMLINTIDEEESRMAIVENGELTEFNIKMSVREPITGNIYKAIVRNVQRGLRAAFVDYGVDRSGFLPLRDVGSEYLNEAGHLAVGTELLVQVVREEKGSKGAMLTTYISLPGRYLVLMPNRKSGGVSRKIEGDADRKRLKQFMDDISQKEQMGFIVRTAGINRNKQELLRDYNMLARLWKDTQKKAKGSTSPALIYEESEFAVRVLRDYFTSDIDEILVDDVETLKKMKIYCKAVSPRSVKMIKQYRDETPIFDKFNIEDQINAIYQERVELKSGAYLIIEPTEAVITIDVNSGRMNKRDVEETAFRTNLQAAEEIAKQLRLRDLGGLIVIDFIDMIDRKHNTEVERTFKNALKTDRSRIQLAKISKFGILELSRQKKQSTIQEISYTTCPQCRGSGWIPSIEYLALSTFRKIKSEAVGGDASEIKVAIPMKVSGYLLNQKRRDISKLEQTYDVSVYISGSDDMLWTESQFTVVKRDYPTVPESTEGNGELPGKEAVVEGTGGREPADRAPKSRRRGGRRRKPKAAAPDGDGATEQGAIPGEEAAAETTVPKKDQQTEPEADKQTELKTDKQAQPAPVPAPASDKEPDDEDSKKKKNIVTRVYDFLKI